MKRPVHLTLAAATAVLALVTTTTGAFAHPTHDGTGKEAGFDFVAEDVSPGGVPQERQSDVPCNDATGEAAAEGVTFKCKGVDLASFIPLSELGGSIWANDVWGWTDPVTGNDYALAKLFEGTAFVDITDEYNPTYLGLLPSPAPKADDFGHIWGDIKTHKSHAYIGAEATKHGVQVFDLNRLRGVTEPRTWTQDAHIDGFGQSHNIAINEDSETLYVIGATQSVKENKCKKVGGGPLMYDISEPRRPQFVGCYGADGYTHDIQCVNYQGPDADYTGREICVASNEDTVTILDVTDKSDVQMLSRVGYDTSAYTHQGWLTEDHKYFLLGDEVDELAGTVTGTTTYIWDVRDLDDAKLIGTHNNGNKSIDHNIFIKDGLAHKSNYTSGLRIDETAEVADGKLTEVGYFDVYPADDDTHFAGTWGNYPFFDDNVIAVSGVEEGLFILKQRVRSTE